MSTLNSCDEGRTALSKAVDMLADCEHFLCIGVAKTSDNKLQYQIYSSTSLVEENLVAYWMRVRDIEMEPTE